METSDFIFKGKRFRYPQDFEQEFKPTKWSIRKFMSFIADFEEDEKYYFAIHTTNILGKYHTSDKDTVNFIRQIKEKRDLNFDINNDQSQKQILLSVEKDNYDTLIKLMTILQKDQIIRGTGKNIAEILINNFGVKLSLSTITTKIYRFSEELNEEKFSKETFKNFHSLCEKI